MATDKKVSELAELTSPAVGDEQHIVDKSDTTDGADGTSKRTTLQTIADWLASLAQTLANKILTSPVINTGVSGSAVLDEDDMASDSATKLATQQSIKAFAERRESPNLLKNGNFINNSTNGYGGTPDDWIASTANPVQGGIPTLTKAQLISILGITDGQIEGFWPLNEASGNALDLSSSGYDLTETSGTIAADEDGLMATARDFELGDTEYFTIADASCANLEISGSQTWFCWVKVEALDVLKVFMSKYDETGVANRHLLYVESAANKNKPNFRLAGLTTAENILSDVSLEAGKWYFICGIYDSANTKLKIWVNGIKKETTASGSAGDSNADFCLGASLGAAADTPAHYFDGLMQNACVLSVALSDDQVKRLWAYTSYKGQKIRRDGTDALLYQDLPQDLVERLRGKTVTLRAKIYAESTNHRIYLYDNDDVDSASPTTANAWEEISATLTIIGHADLIRIGIEASTTDGNMWIKEVALYEGSTLLPYAHSKEDWDRFPRLLKLDPPPVISGYQFEEKKWFSFTPVFAGFSVDPTGVTAKFIIDGEDCHIVYWTTGRGTSNTNAFSFTGAPVDDSTVRTYSFALVWDNGTKGDGVVNTSAGDGTMTIRKTGLAVWTTSGDKDAHFDIAYKIL